MMEAAGVIPPMPEEWCIHRAVHRDSRGLRCEIEGQPQALKALCRWIAETLGYVFAGLVVEQHSKEWLLRYVFHATAPRLARPDIHTPTRAAAEAAPGSECACSSIHVLLRQPLAQVHFPSLSDSLHAADWHEREAEDLFGLVFEGHPSLGDFVLHDDAWQEGLAPMRKEFDGRKPPALRVPNPDWRPERIVHAPGAFGMPVGPVYSSAAESVHFLLETVGEDVIRAVPRLFYKYRAVEKIAEGRRAEDAVLLAERFNGVSAFAHGLAFVQALETIGGIEVPQRALALRVVLAELERLRHHTGAIQEICESTALLVAASQAAMLEEELLRLSCELTGHRYLYGLLTCGGLTREFDDSEICTAVVGARGILERLRSLEDKLVRTSSFLDRLEEVGIVTEQEALAFGVVGPIARASGVARDLRVVQPYCGYSDYAFEVPREGEGDGYARLRVLFAEARQSLAIIEQAFGRLPQGAVRAADARVSAGAALGWTEAPLGAAFHWLRVDDHGTVLRYRIIPPSFANWHVFHRAAEAFAFQDFPIILASFGLSVAENDR
jgi:formate hydrogenlyase subunit 5